ncbi:hypothetical protein ACQKGC_28815, partial [Allorhizobium pseudoryzae]
MELRGSVLRRGAIQMLVVEGRGQPLDASSGLDPAMHEPLGRWRIAGEICDGKCYAGAMRPGSGLAHKACANLCLIGEIPAVFVTVDPVGVTTRKWRICPTFKNVSGTQVGLTVDVVAFSA